MEEREHTASGIIASTEGGFGPSRLGTVAVSPIGAEFAILKMIKSVEMFDLLLIVASM